MGCSSSKDRLQTVDDSVHVMLKHDKKRQQAKGQQPHGFVPRAEHPLLKPKPIVASEEPDDGDGAASGSAPTTEATSES
eukprot:CAMPEP_0113623620 /NCGR_PEP_ID=MMETSP0017_2-20120614/12155_1 /TAXON_ID=2856 /ORGANISM="Cylindrotheca closterium" /LENGTH=78 /DNA_ID=CAMNT_0000533583 /DNA_START=200 /DNA_END=436 /DNA_ORIENTATION=- /assembly_acc=CAM_ASM_000147